MVLRISYYLLQLNESYGRLQGALLHRDALGRLARCPEAQRCYVTLMIVISTVPLMLLAAMPRPSPTAGRAPLLDTMPLSLRVDHCDVQDYCK